MKKRWVLALILLMLTSLLAACGAKNDSSGKSDSTGSTNSDSKRAVLVLPEQIGVNPFFQSMDEGFKRAGEEFNVTVKTIESTDPAGFEQNLRAAVADKYDLVITATFQAEDALKKVAEENPDMTFAIIDTVVDLPNVRSVVFREHEAAYLMGAAAGLSTKTNKVGAIVALESSLLSKYTVGFEEGLKSTNPSAEFFVNYVGSFEDPAKAKELALVQFSKGADFIAGMAAVGDFGVFEAAKEKGFYTSGQDVDRTVNDPEHIVLSQLKGTDTVAYETVKSFAEGKFTFEAVDYGLKEDGVGVTFITMDSPSVLSPFIGQETVDKVRAIAEEIKAGTLEVKNPLAQ